MAFTQAALVAELENDPKSLGLEADVNNVGGPQIAVIRDKLNLKSGAGSEPVPALPIQPNEFKSLINAAEFDGLTGLQLQQVEVQLTGMVEIGAENIQDWIAICFANCPNTLAALQAAGTQTGSRAEVLFGTGFSVNDDQVLTACNTILA